MPIVRISLFSGRDQEKKNAVASQITAVFSAVMGVPSSDTTVIFEEVEKADWYCAGVPFSQNIIEPSENS
ncbi:tautomerase family protein [Brucella intermedia]|uniref:tautomerase family protein n=1 Tax=Brucella intermedia TaxID=94625 RepID=UPI00124F2CE3|nr:4-oxalocrotonate tautomerase family protein [Brucella intermedia]KAB2711380.1 4-oxalocrotonate tautomerase family protein [Brucella intermedia]